jgi:hypothetical protein
MTDHHASLEQLKFNFDDTFDEKKNKKTLDSAAKRG